MFKNLAANLFGKTVVGFSNLILAPIYAGILGIEAFGIVGFFLVLQSLFSIIDAGITTTVVREISKYKASGIDDPRLKGSVRSLEISYWVLSIALGVLIFLLSPIILSNWLQVKSLEPKMVVSSIRLMGLAIAFQFPGMFYVGGLIGLEKQVLSNLNYSAFVLLRHAAAIFALNTISKNVPTYFAAQLIINIFFSAILFVIFWKRMNEQSVHTGTFSLRAIKENMGFTAGMSLLSLLLIILSQLDKLMLSKLANLEALGYYTLAWTLASAVYSLQAPVITSVFPRMNRIISSGDLDNLKQIYRQGTQAVSIILTPVVCVIFWFPKEILSVWSRNVVFAERSSTILSILIVLVFFSGVASMPLALQEAFGWITRASWITFGAIVIAIPALFVFIKLWGPIGAAVGATIIKIVSSIIQNEVAHRRYVADIRKALYLKDIGMPLLFSFSLSAGLRVLFDKLPLSISPVVILGLIYVACLTVVIIAFPKVMLTIWQRATTLSWKGRR